jgi:flagellar basal body-associated protein FliL
MPEWRITVRAVLLIIIVAIVAVIAAMATGFLNISQTGASQAPQATASVNGVAARGGRAPAFEVETGSIRVGSKDATVQLPTLEVARPQDQAAQAATNNAM